MHGYVKKFQAYFLELKKMYPSFGKKNMALAYANIVFLKGPFRSLTRYSPQTKTEMIKTY